MLNLLEGDIANGGFHQLYENKGTKFIRTVHPSFKKIGSKSALRLVEQALQVIENNKAAIDNYKSMEKQLSRLDSRFYRLKESIPILLERYRQTTVVRERRGQCRP